MSSLVEKHTFTVVQMLVETGTVTKSGKQFEVDAMVVPHAWVIENGWISFLASCGIDQPMEPGIGKDLIYFPSGIRIHGLMRVATSVPIWPNGRQSNAKLCAGILRSIERYVFFSMRHFFLLFVLLLFFRCVTNTFFVYATKSAQHSIFDSLRYFAIPENTQTCVFVFAHMCECCITICVWSNELALSK